MPEKNVLIITLFRSLNAGAYLQAFALQEVLRSKGLAPFFLETYDFKQRLLLYRPFLRKDQRSIKNILFNIQKIKEFSRSEKKFEITKKADDSFSAAFMGSDEIWSTINKTFIPRPEFFGLNLPDRIKKFSYAPSAGNTSEQQANQRKDLYKGIANLDLVSVRDESTRDAVKALPGVKDIHHVLDPTFLHDFSSNEESFDINKPYAVVYSYGFNQQRREEVKRYAKRNGLMLVSPTFNQSWCDLSLACNPFQFLSIIKNAECVITDTFHGSVFSIKYRKPFVTYSSQKKKVQALLEDLAVKNAHVDEGDLDKIDFINTDYSATDGAEEERVAASYAYLNQCLSLIEEN